MIRLLLRYHKHLCFQASCTFETVGANIITACEEGGVSSGEAKKCGPCVVEPFNALKINFVLDCNNSDNVSVNDSVDFVPFHSAIDDQTLSVKDGISLYHEQSSVDKTGIRTCDLVVNGELFDKETKVFLR